MSFLRLALGRVLGLRVYGLIEAVGLALESIRASKVRAALTILGIAVGVFVVVVISAAIHGINSSVAKDFESAGPTTFFLSRYPISFEACDGTDDTCKWLHNPPLAVAENRALNELPSVRTAGAELDLNRPVRYKDRSLRGTQVIGYTPNWTIIDAASDLYPGRSFTDAEAANGDRVAVVNDEMARKLFADGDPLDKIIEISAVPFTVIGVYHYQASFLSGGNRPRAIIPIETARRALNASFDQLGIAVIPRAGVSRDETIDDVTALLRGRRGLRPSAESNFAVLTQDKLFEV